MAGLGEGGEGETKEVGGMQKKKKNKSSKY